MRTIVHNMRPLLPRWVVDDKEVRQCWVDTIQDIQQLERSSLELASQLDLVICHSMEKLLDLTDGLVVENDATMRRKTKSRVKMYDCMDAIPWVRSYLQSDV